MFLYLIHNLGIQYAMRIYSQEGINLQVIFVIKYNISLYFQNDYRMFEHILLNHTIGTNSKIKCLEMQFKHSIHAIQLVFILQQ